MKLNPHPGSLSPFEVARAMSSSETQVRDADYWSCQMEAVSRRRDRDSFLRIYDHYAPRVRLYLKGIGSPEAIRSMN